VEGVLGGHRPGWQLTPVPRGGAIEVAGVEQLELVARRLREVGDKGLRKELHAGLNRATKPMKAAIRSSAERNLPASGGLNRLVARSRLSTSTKIGRNPAVRVTGALSGHDLKAMDRGRLRHPVFGNRRAWVNQKIRPRWFTDAATGEVPAARREIVQVLDDVAASLTRGVAR
jgi:hypothetical protein